MLGLQAQLEQQRQQLEQQRQAALASEAELQGQLEAAGARHAAELALQAEADAATIAALRGRVREGRQAVEKLRRDCRKAQAEASGLREQSQLVRSFVVLFGVVRGVVVVVVVVAHICVCVCVGGGVGVARLQLPVPVRCWVAGAQLPVCARAHGWSRGVRGVRRHDGAEARACMQEAAAACDGDIFLHPGRAPFAMSSCGSCC